MGSPLKTHLASRLVKRIFGVYLIVSALLTAVQLYLVYERESKHVAHAIEQANHVIAPFLADAIWEFDKVRIRHAAKSIQRNPLIAEVVIRDEVKKVMASLPPEGGEAHDHTHYSFHYPIVKVIGLQTESLGSIEYITTNHIILQRVMYPMILTGIQSLVMMIVLWILFVMVLKRIVSHPLNELTQAMDEFTPRLPAQSDENQAPIPIDEIALLHETFTRMKEGLVQQEAQLRNHSDDLSKSVEEKTHELQSVNQSLKTFIEKLREANQEAQAANHAKSMFLANMSHEMRTPLNGIIGFTDMLLQENLQPGVQAQLETVKNCSDSLLDLVNDILDLTKIEADKIELDAAPFSLEGMILQASEVAMAKHAAKGEVLGNKEGHVELYLHMQPLCVDVIGDVTRIKQVLINLINNALKFTKQGHVEVRAAAVVKDESVYLSLSVNDTGIGMSLEAQTRIFTAFEQADTSTTRRYGGTGLGITICDRLLKLMGSQLSVQSEEGKGSSFTFEICLPKGADHEADMPVCKDQHVAMVSRYRPLGEAVEQMLQVQGATLSHAETVGDLLKKDGHRPSVILVDVDSCRDQLDVLTGLVSAKSGGSPVPIICLANAQEIPRDKTSTGGILWMPKPIAPRRLYAMLRRALGNEVASVSTPTPVAGAGTVFAPTGTPVTLDTVHSLHLLVVEDNMVNQKLIVKVLAKMGHGATVANNGQEGVEAALANKYDAVLMDMQMPEMNGLEATEALRKKSYSVPIIAMTANAFESDQQACLDAGMDAFLSKPLKPKLLNELLHSLCGSTEIVS